VRSIKNLFSQQAAETAEALEDSGRLGQHQRKMQQQQQEQQQEQQQMEQSAETDERDGVEGAGASRTKRAPQRPAPAGACTVEPDSDRLDKPAYAPLMTVAEYAVWNTGIRTAMTTGCSAPT
jgi:hypothetical protein